MCYGTLARTQVPRVVKPQSARRVARPFADPLARVGACGRAESSERASVDTPDAKHLELNHPPPPTPSRA
jgi:hypothetical protein